MKKDDLPAFAAAVLEQLYDLDFIGVKPAAALASVILEIEDMLELNRPDILEERHRQFAIPESRLQDYQERFYNIGEGKMILAGIRHISASKDQPFVQCFLNFTPNPLDLSYLKKFALDNFAVFAPKFISFWLRSSVSVNGVIPGRQYVVGALAKIRETEKPAGYGRITLEEIQEDLDIDWYHEAYDRFHSKQPQLKKWVSRTGKEDLDRCAADGMLFRVLVDGQRAGLIGAQSEPLLGVPAVYMTELLLTEEFKGQALAKALQRKFLDRLPTHFELVWGTIDAKNRPSLQTALGVGRKAIRSEYFIALDESL